jgi:[ribosomal protein S5]-alanine N-acetyltransferase
MKLFKRIKLKDSGEIIGEIDLYDFDKLAEHCDVSYSLGYEWWNRVMELKY